MRHFDFSGRKILVVGDLMLDRYLTGSVGRISPEAPVAVLLREGDRTVLGGAANVIANIASLGATVETIGVTGSDPGGANLVAMLGALPGVGTRHVVSDGGRPTTCKTRVMSGLHQLVRIDEESNHPIGAEIEAELTARIRDAAADADVVVVSDYMKGLCSDAIIRAAIEAAQAHGKPCVVDPKRRDFAIYRGATIVKPNRRELSVATGLSCGTDAEAEAAAAAAVEATGAAILVTRSEQGMSYLERGKPMLHLRTGAQDVFDVSGAGDTVLALVALGVGARLPISETIRLANRAAGVVVSKIGTAVVGAQELDDALEAEAHKASVNKGAHVGLDAAVQRRQEWKRRGLKVGFTNGCYDLLHPGHVSLLKRAAAACDRLIVGINSDASVSRLKGPTRPIQDERSRATVLGAIASVDLVIVFGEDTPAEVIEALQPDLLVKGADYTEENVVGAGTVRAAGGQVLLVPIVENQSTSSIVKRMSA